MRRFVALAALSLLVSLSLTAIVFAVTRPGRCGAAATTQTETPEVPA